MIKMREILNMGVGKDRGEIGIEIEVEGKRLPQEIPGWKKVGDASLKAEESCEYVLRGPMPLDKAEEALDNLAQAYDRNKTRVDDTVRAGIHIHINIRDLTVIQLFNFIVTTMVFESVLSEYCGEGRQGNLFCLRSYDAEGFNLALERLLDTGQFNTLYTDDIRYGFMNLKAIWQHGSLEFRALRGTADMKRIKDWILILLKLKEHAIGLDNPIEVIENFSGLGLQEYKRLVFGPLADKLKCKKENEALLYSMRNAQDIAFYGNWDQVKMWGTTNPFQKFRERGRGMEMNNMLPVKGQERGKGEGMKFR